MGAFADHLSVSFHPERNPLDQLRALLLSVGASVLDDRTFRVGEGTVKLYPAYGVLYCSATGGALACLRAAGCFMDWLSAISEWPHRITRLDVARDFDIDGPDVLDALRSRYPTGHVHLGRKALPVKLELGIRADGRETGTFYVGHRSKARCTARVYDKQRERLDRASQDIPPRTRFEVTVKQDYGATLRDAAEPDRLFWHTASPALLDAPDGVPPWSPDWSQGWKADARPDLLPADVLARRLGNSPELELLFSIADQMGPNGRVWLVRRISQLAGVEVKGSLAAAPVASPEASDA